MGKNGDPVGARVIAWSYSEVRSETGEAGEELTVETGMTGVLA